MKSEQALKQIVAYALEQLRDCGATQASALLTQTQGLDVSVHNQAVETLEFTGEKSLAFTAYVGKQKGTVGISDISPESIRTAAQRAVDIARVLEADPAVGLPDLAQLAQHFRPLQLDYPWDELTPERAIAYGVELERMALSQHASIKQSEGVNVATQRVQHVLGNSLGFLHLESRTRHSWSCVLIAEKNGAMQRDYAYDVRRDFHDLQSLEHVAEQAVQRTVARLGARSVPTATDIPVLFDAPLAAGLINHFLGAINGGVLYRKASFLCDSLGQSVFAPGISLLEDPFLLKGMGSCNFDDEGVAVAPRTLVEAGVVRGYVLSSYTARRLGMTTTANAGGVHNIIVQGEHEDRASLLRKMGRGLYVTELMGQGVNLVTGDYSRGAAGFWVENGEIAYPVEGITIAGNLRNMFGNIIGLGSDIETRAVIRTGSLLVSGMTIAGAQAD